MHAFCNKKQLFGAWNDHAGLSCPLSGFDAVALLLHGAYLVAQYPCYHHFIYNRVPCTFVSAKGFAVKAILQTGSEINGGEKQF